MTHSPPAPRVLFFEVNEADRHFLDRFIAEGKLPNLRAMRGEGALVTTKIPTWRPTGERAWRDISPWIIWPSVYTGLTPEEHGIIGFGQDPRSLAGRCVWDVLDREGTSVGVFGSLMSYPPRTAGHAAFYIPEALADRPDCFPESARPLQDFFVFSARNYSESFGRAAVKAVSLLMRTPRSGVRKRNVARVLAQVPAEVLVGKWCEPERAMLQSYLSFDAFARLYREHRPGYACVHMNHVAYMQHRFWRAAEPGRFADELSETDRRFFASVEQRKAYERKLANWIERSFVYTDRALGEAMSMVDDNTIILVGSALGQRPLDPANEIHNPVVRLAHERELFDGLGLSAYEVLHQMNPDLTVNFADAAAAAHAAAEIGGLFVNEGEALFEVQQRGRQLFLEMNMPRRGDGAPLTIRHASRAGLSFRFARYVSEHGTNDQSTAHHKDVGWLLAWSRGRRVTAPRKVISVTEIAPSILALYGIAPRPWMHLEGPPAFQLAPRQGAHGEPLQAAPPSS